MRTVYRIIGFSLGACAPAAFVYGFWLLHHGLGFIVGALIAACYAHYYSPEQKTKRKHATRMDKLEASIRQIDEVNKSAEQLLKHRGVN